MSHGKRLTPELRPGETLTASELVDFLAPYKAAIYPLPFFLFVAEAALATACSHLYADTDWLLKMALGQLLAVNATFAGLLHFAPAMYDFYTSMIFVPFPDFWLYATGLALMAAGVGIAFSATQVPAAWALVALFVLMFPANVACVFMRRPRDVVADGSLTKALLRLPMQILFIYWALWFTSPPLPVPM